MVGTSDPLTSAEKVKLRKQREKEMRRHKREQKRCPGG
jgi:hypothetical protein